MTGDSKESIDTRLRRMESKVEKCEQISATIARKVYQINDRLESPGKPASNDALKWFERVVWAMLAGAAIVVAKELNLL